MTTKIPPGAPDLEAAKTAFAQFCATVAKLRDPDGGCPWDLKQDHVTLRRFMIEEAYEAAEAMIGTDASAIREELGDVLLQVVLNSQIAHDHGKFSIVDVVDAINAKMRRRHPHVFGSDAEKQAHQNLTSDGVRSNWEVIKASEKAAGGATPRGYFADAEGKGPATLQAQKIGKIAAKIRFDWDTPKEVFDQVRSEVDEVGHEMAHGNDREKLAEEIGDLYFSLAQLCRHLDLDPEVVSIDANRKFMRRFAALEGIAKGRGQDVTKASREELEQLWRDVKKGEK